MSPRITLHSSAGKTTLTPSSVSAQRASTRKPTQDEDVDVDMYQSDEEVDELDSIGPADDSALQPQWESISTTSVTAPASSLPKPVMKKARPKPATSRAPGQSMVPVSKIESIVQADAQNGSPSKEASYMIALATEEFIRKLTRVAHSRATIDKRTLTTYDDFADATRYFDEYKFLQETVPKPVPLQEALAERKLIRKRHEALLNGVDLDSEPVNTTSAPKTQTDSVPYKSKEWWDLKAERYSYHCRQRQDSNSNSSAPTEVRVSGLISDGPPPRKKRASENSKKMQVDQDSGATETSISNRPTPSTPSEHGIPLIPNGTVTNNNGSVKIKIRPRLAPAPTSTPQSQLPVLSLGPPKEAVGPVNGILQEESPSIESSGNVKPSRSSGRKRQRKQTAKAEEKGKAKSNANGKAVLFAPVGVDASEPPLWTRVPLPPPPSPNPPRPRSEMNEDAGAPACDGDAHVDFRDALNGKLPNPGRTIYSQR